MVRICKNMKKAQAKEKIIKGFLEILDQRSRNDFLGGWKVLIVGEMGILMQREQNFLITKRCFSTL